MVTRKTQAHHLEGQGTLNARVAQERSSLHRRQRHHQRQKRRRHQQEHIYEGGNVQLSADGMGAELPDDVSMGSPLGEFFGLLFSIFVSLTSIALPGSIPNDKLGMHQPQDNSASFIDLNIDEDNEDMTFRGWEESEEEDFREYDDTVPSWQSGLTAADRLAEEFERVYHESIGAYSTS